MLTEAEKRAKNAAWQRASRARRKAAKLAAGDTSGKGIEQVTTPEPIEHTGPSVVVDIPEEAPKLGFKERMLQRFGGGTQPTQKTPVKASGKGKRVDSNNLLTSVLPTLLAGFLATYSRNMMGDPYKGCAPSKEEVSAILTPLMDILARRVQVYGKASPDVTDLINSIIASIAYGTRAYLTYTMIKERESQSHAHTGHSVQPESSKVSANGYRANGTGGDRHNGHRNGETPISGLVGSVPLTSEYADSSIDGTLSGDVDTDSREYALALLAKANGRDVEYRRKHGIN